MVIIMTIFLILARAIKDLLVKGGGSKLGVLANAIASSEFY
jgi:hypothetical protein